MYIPKHYQGSNQDHAFAFMQRFNFALLISSHEGRPVATHLPFLISGTAEKLVLTSHMARANPQWKSLDAQESLVVFSEPHAYISPRHYDKEQNVPTWNYLAVHAYGAVQLFYKQEEIMGIMETTIRTFEEGYLAQWEGLDQQYKDRLSRGVVGLKIEVKEVQFKEKLSQNKNAEERRRIIDSLSGQKDGSVKAVADYMDRREKDGG